MALDFTRGATSHSSMDLGLVGIVLVLTNVKINDYHCLVCGKLVDVHREHYEVEFNGVERVIHSECWNEG